MITCTPALTITIYRSVAQVSDEEFRLPRLRYVRLVVGWTKVRNLSVLSPVFLCFMSKLDLARTRTSPRAESLAVPKTMIENKNKKIVEREKIARSATTWTGAPRMSRKLVWSFPVYPHVFTALLTHEDLAPLANSTHYFSLTLSLIVFLPLRTFVEYSSSLYTGPRKQ